MKPTSRTSLSEKLNAIISEARLICDAPNSSPGILHQMLTKGFLRKIAGVKGLRMHLMAGGLNAEIRRFLKAVDDDDGGASADQLTLWPPHLQSKITDIDRSRVFVPSIGEFVPLDPEHITPSQTLEAGEYLIARGRECINVGNKLIRLAKEKW